MCISRQIIDLYTINKPSSSSLSLSLSLSIYRLTFKRLLPPPPPPFKKIAPAS